jgi:hypothetical protein
VAGIAPLHASARKIGCTAEATPPIFQRHEDTTRSTRTRPGVVRTILRRTRSCLHTARGSTVVRHHDSRCIAP